MPARRQRERRDAGGVTKRRSGRAVGSSVDGVVVRRVGWWFEGICSMRRREAPQPAAQASVLTFSSSAAIAAIRRDQP